ncbi:hypothetical protein [Brachyspira sp.]|uniref:hypothetical protein n=1 Tax=Brachyspira sp. TaxID=1977261 RepID=UPI002618F7A5|nr:hypothetical protein [Brachyspira sp.]
MNIKRIIITLILEILLCIVLYPFGGKPITIEKIRPYYTSSETAKVDVYIYTNIGDNTNYNYICFAIADSIANQIEYNKTLKLQSETNYVITPVDFERAYNYKVYQFTNITYTSKNDGSNISIITNYEITTYTNWGGVRSNVQLITPESKGFDLQEDEVLFDYNGTNVILKNTNNFTQKVDIGKNYYEYFGDDIKKYVFTRNSDVAIFGTIEYDRPNINITTYIAYIREKKINSYFITIPEAKIDEQIPNYALDIANKISFLDKTGIIAIDVSPKDAFIYVDDVLIGKSGETLYIPALTTNDHRFTIKKDSYETIDTMLSFQNPKENILLNFKLVELTNKARVIINIPGEEQSSVVINGIKENPTNIINRHFGFGTYSIKITNRNYIDYYGTFTIDNTNSLNLTPNMKRFKEPTLVDKIFKNYERNTKVFLGLTIASAIFSVGTYIYAGEVLDSTMVNYYNKYQNSPNRPPINLRNYNTAMNIYIAGMVITGAFALTTGIYYMLWINENNFAVEQLSFNADYRGANIMYSWRW